MKQRFLLIFLILQATSRLAGQQFTENEFDHYTTASGLSHNSITAITQDTAGYVWIATSYGLNRFNGSRFVQYHSSSDSASLAAEELPGMAWLDRHRLAVLTAGLHVIDTRTGNTHNVFIPYHDRQYQYKFNMIEGVLGDEGGNTYILSRSGFYHYNKDYRLVSRFDFYTEEEVKFSHFFFGRDLFVLDHNRLLIVSINGLYIYDKQKRSVSRMKPADCPLMAGLLSYPASHYLFFQYKPGNFFILKWGSDSLIYLNTIEHKKAVSHLPFQAGGSEFHYRSRLVAANDTLLYITGHNAGFYKMRFYPESGAVRFYPEKYFSSYLCTALLHDKDNHLWIATNRGLFRQNPQRLQVQVSALPAGIEYTFPDIKVDDIFVSADKIYAATRGRGGLFQFDKKTLRPEKQFFFKEKTYDVNSIRAIMPAGHSSLLLGTNSSLLLFDQLNKKEKILTPPQWHEGADWANDLYKDRRGNIWIGAEHIYKYNPQTESFAVIQHLPLLLSTPTVMQEDTSGNIWLAGHGLARYNTVLDHFDVVLDSFPYIKMPNNQMNALAIDEQNTVWFNSNNNGLTGYNTARKSFRLFTRSNGLPDDNIASLIVVGSKLWIACYSGIACMDLQTSRIVSFGKEDGFPDMPVMKGARFFYDKDQRQLYIGFAMAVARFNPDSILHKKQPPQIFIEALVINGKKADRVPGKSVTTSWQNTDIRITIGTIDFSGGAVQRFAYRVVKNSSTAWISIGSQPSFSILSLAPGTHRIQVKTYAPNNRWPDQISEISITVLSPLWQQGWFTVLISCMVVVSLYTFIKWRTGLARKKEKELAGINEQLVEARLSALQAQMNPHFIFNALNSIKRMILDEDNTKASRYLSKFALMIRMTLEHSKEIFVTLRENIEYIRAYLDMEQLRFDDSFTYSILTDENVDAEETSIPSMMIQPLVENAIWHGLMQAEAGKKIKIAFSQTNNKIICMVEDNGIGIRRSEKLREKNRPFHHSVGLENLQKRIKIMNEKYNLGCSLEIIDLQQAGKHTNGTRVVLQFNLINV